MRQRLLVELGNGDSFLFDIGTGSTERLSGLEADYSKLDKVFISHLTAPVYAEPLQTLRPIAELQQE